jgi:hypothetical protein
MTESTAPEAAEPAATYTTGYGKPPLHTRFRKGQSGNPAGRPRKSGRPCAKELTLVEAYRAVVVRDDGDGHAVPVPALQAILRSQVTLAIKGNGPGPARRSRSRAGDRRGGGHGKAHRRADRSRHCVEAVAKRALGLASLAQMVVPGFFEIP